MSFEFMDEIRERLDYMEDFLEKRSFITKAMEEERSKNGTDTELYRELWDEFVAIQEDYERR